jgi:hypothetical protein
MATTERSSQPDGYFLRTLKRYLSNRRWLMMYIFGRFAVVRSCIIGLVGWKRRLWGSASPDLSRDAVSRIFPGISADEAVDALRRDGFFAPLMLPPYIVGAVRRFASENMCSPDRDPSVRFAYHEHRLAEQQHGRPILLARYYNTAAGCKAIAQLQEDALLREIAARYIGAPARHIGNRLWWSFAREAGELDRVRSGQKYHWDLDDYRTVTFFFYLTDVDAAGGPHTLVRGSHRRKPLRWLFSIFKSRDEGEVLDQYGRDKVVTMCGPAGFGFAEDLLCFHKGAAPRKQDRLILQIRFGVFEYGNANDVLPGYPTPLRPAAA